MKGHLWWNLERKPLSSEKMDGFLHQTLAKYPFQRLQQRRFQSSLISRVHSKHSKVQENKSDNSPCRYCILELSYQKNLPTCLPARDQLYTLCSPRSEMFFISPSLQHEARHQDTAATLIYSLYQPQWVNSTSEYKETIYRMGRGEQATRPTVQRAHPAAFPLMGLSGFLRLGVTITSTDH